MRNNLILVIVGRKWQIANGYHAFELRTTSKSALPPFNDGSCVPLCLNSTGDKKVFIPCSAFRPCQMVTWLARDKMVMAERIVCYPGFR